MLTNDIQKNIIAQNESLVDQVNSVVKNIINVSGVDNINGIASPAKKSISKIIQEQDDKISSLIKEKGIDPILYEKLIESQIELNTLIDPKWMLNKKDQNWSKIFSQEILKILSSNKSFLNLNSPFVLLEERSKKDLSSIVFYFINIFRIAITYKHPDDFLFSMLLTTELSKESKKFKDKINEKELFEIIENELLPMISMGLIDLFIIKFLEIFYRSFEDPFNLLYEKIIFYNTFFIFRERNKKGYVFKWGDHKDIIVAEKIFNEVKNKLKEKDDKGSWKDQFLEELNKYYLTNVFF